MRPHLHFLIRSVRQSALLAVILLAGSAAAALPLAQIKLPAGFRIEVLTQDVPGARAIPLPVGNVADLAVGDKVMIIGSPVGLDFTVHEGAVSSLHRSAYGVAYLQLDAKISPGNSGGPVIDGFGRVVADGRSWTIVLTTKIVQDRRSPGRRVRRNTHIVSVSRPRSPILDSPTRHDVSRSPRSAQGVLPEQLPQTERRSCRKPKVIMSRIAHGSCRGSNTKR